MPSNGVYNNGSGTVVKISCGLNHSIALTEKGHIFTWG
jgi:alpha-tubulin suppressor-like RCC1 family protein